jgi:uncharacterized membrane protein YdjX (TVP38/TMEM64 family)
MLETFWLSFQEWVLTLGLLGVLLIFVLSILHPTVEGPAALLLLTILTILIDSIWLASLILLVGFSIGFSLFYVLVHYLHQKNNSQLERFTPTKKAIEWVKQQPTWKHIIVIGMPLVYTYPLRIAFTIQHKKFLPFWWETFLQYAFLTVGNLLLYFGVIEFIFWDLPLWGISLILILVSISIYLIRTKVKVT